MSRPKPTVLIETVFDQRLKNGKVTKVSEQILSADAIYAVFYKGKPINIRLVDLLRDYPGAKYKKNAFSNSGGAFNLAERLNETFNTNEFKVIKLTQGVEVNEDEA